MRILAPFFMLVAVILLVFGPMLGCLPAPKTPREKVRAALNLTAEGVRTVDMICAGTARAKSDLSLANTCAKAYDKARDSLVGIAEGVDAWQEGKQGSTLCSLKKASEALASFRQVAFQAGAALPPLVDDALAFANTVGGCDAGK